MNPFFRNILKVTPTAINKIPVRFLNEDDIYKAIRNGSK